LIPDFPKKGTPLTYAVMSKNTEIVGKLLVKENGKYPTDEYLRTPLHHAAFDGNLRVCELLIKHFKDVSPKDKYHMTPLHFATLWGEFDVCKLIIEKSKGGNSTKSPVLDKNVDGVTTYEMALPKGSTKLCKIFLEDIKERDPEHEFNKHALHWPAYYGRVDLYRMLIAKLDDKNPRKSKYGTTPLHLAAMYGHFNVCELIIKSIKKSEEKNPGDSSGDTPLHEACGNGYLKICKLIMAHIGKEKVVNMSGETPLHHAATMGHFLVCQWLIENTTDMNATDEEGKTPYQYAVERGHEDIIELLTQYSCPQSKRPRCK
jgi:ankyrin repeat protein